MSETKAEQTFYVCTQIAERFEESKELDIISKKDSKKS